MEESIADALVKTADVLHWLGRYREANACTLFSRLARAWNIHTLDALEKHVLLCEQKAKPIHEYHCNHCDQPATRWIDGIVYCDSCQPDRPSSPSGSEDK